MEIKVNNTLFTGKVLLHFSSLDSTNNYAKSSIAKNNPIDGTVILADEQLAGRGQAGNIWQSDKNKNLTFSIIYKTTFLKAIEQFNLNMIVSLGIWEALKNYITIKNNTLSSNVSIKWPNDIYIDNQKIAGILIENTIIGMYLNYSIIGIGLNINQTTFLDGINATSLNLILKEEIDKTIILNKILTSIEHFYLLLKENKIALLKETYLQNLLGYNKMALYRKKNTLFEATLINIDATGNLILATKSGNEQFGFKEVEFIIN